MNESFNTMKGGDFRLLRWIEIEGLPYALGTGPGNLGSSFFASRVAAERFEGIRAWLRNPAPIEDLDLDVLEAFPQHASELQAEILDVDDTIAALTNTDPGSARLSADLAAAATTIVYTGSDPGFVAANGLAYIGNETVSYTSHNSGTKTLSGVTRGKFRSVARAWGAGIPIAPYPYTLTKRRVWYYLCASSAPASGSNYGFTMANRWLRFAGTLESLRTTDDLATFELRAASLEKELDRDVFRSLRNLTGPLEAKIRGVDSTEGIDVGGQWSAPGVSTLLAADEYLPVRGGSEILLVERVGSTEFLQIIGRGLFNTPVEELSAGVTLREVVPLNTGVSGAHTGSPTSNLENFASYFASYPDPGSFGDGGGTSFPADHPIAILLQVMLSGGEGTVDGNGYSAPLRSFNLFAPGTGPDWFLGIDLARLDLRAICNLANETAWLRVSGIVEEPINFVEFARSLLRPFGFYATYTAEGLLTIRSTRPPMPTLDLRTVDNSKRIRSSTTGFDSNLSAVVSEVEYRFGWDLQASKFRRIVVLKVNEGDLFSAGRGRRLVYESKFLYTGSERIPGELTRSVGIDVVELLRQRGDFFQSRYARPPAIITETVTLDLIDVALGDLVAVTATNVPNPSGGTRGLTSSVAEVIGKRVDEIEKTIELTLLLTGFRLTDYRAIPWAGVLTGLDPNGDGTELYVYEDPPGAKNGGRAGWYNYAANFGAGPLVCYIGENMFIGPAAGAQLLFFDNLGTAGEPRWDLSSPTDTGTSGGIDDPGGVMFNSTSNTLANRDGSLVVLGDWYAANSVSAGTRLVGGVATSVTIGEIFAFLANNSGRIPLLVGDDPGHKLFPS